MTIKYYTRSVYGVPRRYASDPDVARITLKLTGKKSIDDNAKEALESLGIEFEQVFDPKVPT